MGWRRSQQRLGRSQMGLWEWAGETREGPKGLGEGPRDNGNTTFVGLAAVTASEQRNPLTARLHPSSPTTQLDRKTRL